MKFHYYRETDSLYIELCEKQALTHRRLLLALLPILMRKVILLALTLTTPARSSIFRDRKPIPYLWPICEKLLYKPQEDKKLAKMTFWARKPGFFFTISS